ncbi:pentatricopeptide repeat-containing protein At2g34400-like [Cryptomeria japonica]|uniref:pentatricopeptide repeat-containing protein At2g34400-like n=1 Tax=Cryptomeria japonica TaxID=3369 RepID=UPI0027D9DBAB|nr:pentatricopeptide repeat-containing protein At2g34400-like [Cryptomeria japonica]
MGSSSESIFSITGVFFLRKLLEANLEDLLLTLESRERLSFSTSSEDKLSSKTICLRLAGVLPFPLDREREALGEANRVKLGETTDKETIEMWFHGNRSLLDMRKMGLFKKALELFKQMQLIGIKLIIATFASILPACAKMGSLKQENGPLDEASRIFKEIPQRDVTSWNAISTGYVQNSLVDKPLEIIKGMQFEGIKPNSGTITNIPTTCGRMGALEQSVEIHQILIQSGFLSNVVIVTTLIDVYAKCGRIK